MVTSSKCLEALLKKKTTYDEREIYSKQKPTTLTGEWYI